MSTVRSISLFGCLVFLLPCAATAAEPTEPSMGRYNIRSYGASNRPPIFLGHFVLEAGGKYTVHLPGGRMVGEGTYAFDAANKEVKWLTGKYKDEAWEGRFLVASDAKPPVIWLKSTTRATYGPEDK